MIPFDQMKTMQVGSHIEFYSDFYDEIITVIRKKEQQWLFFTDEAGCVDVASLDLNGDWQFAGC